MDTDVRGFSVTARSLRGRRAWSVQANPIRNGQHLVESVATDANAEAR
jgi:hypothetical protein